MNDPVVLAIDGGGTATSAALVHGSGRVLWQGVGGRSNPTDSTDEDLLEQWAALLTPAASAAPRNLAVFAGVAGGSHPKLGGRLHAILEALFPDALSVTVTHDGFNALYRGTHGRPGAVVIAGTGSVVMARDAGGCELRVGGFGYLLGDEGSGYDLGRRAIRAVLDAHDGTGPQTALTAAVLSAMDLSGPKDIVPAVYEGGRARIAALSVVVTGAAALGDTVAVEIVRESAASLAGKLRALLGRFECPRPVPVVLSGGVWQSPAVADAFMQACGAAADIRWIKPAMPPVYGAAVNEMVLRGELPDIGYARAFAATYGAAAAPDEGEWPWKS